MLPRPKGSGELFILGFARLIYDLNPPGCGALFLLRGTWPTCKKQTAFLLRLADFCGAPQRVLAKTGALRQTQLPVSSTGCGRCVCPCSALYRFPRPGLGLGNLIYNLNPPSTLLDVSPLPLRGIPPSGGVGLWLLPHPAALPQLLGWCYAAAAQPATRRSSLWFRAPAGARPQAGGFLCGRVGGFK